MVDSECKIDNNSRTATQTILTHLNSNIFVHTNQLEQCPRPWGHTCSLSHHSDTGSYSHSPTGQSQIHCYTGPHPQLFPHDPPLHPDPPNTSQDHGQHGSQHELPCTSKNCDKKKHHKIMSFYHSLQQIFWCGCVCGCVCGCLWVCLCVCHTCQVESIGLTLQWDCNTSSYQVAQTKSQFNQNGNISLTHLATYCSPCTLTSCMITRDSFFQY